MSDIERLLQVYYGDPDKLKSPDAWGRDESAWGRVDRTLSDIFGPINRRVMEPMLGPPKGSDWRTFALDALNAATLMGPGRGPPRLPPRGPGHTVLPGEPSNVVAHPGRERMATQSETGRPPADVVPIRAAPAEPPPMPEPRPATTADVLTYVPREAGASPPSPTGRRADVVRIDQEVPKENAWPFYEERLRSAVASGDRRAAEAAFNELNVAMAENARMVQLQGAASVPVAERHRATANLSEALRELGPEFHARTAKRHFQIPYEWAPGERGIAPYNDHTMGDTRLYVGLQSPKGDLVNAFRRARDDGLLSLAVPAGVAVGGIGLGQGQDEPQSVDDVLSIYRR